MFQLRALAADDPWADTQSDDPWADTRSDESPPSANPAFIDALKSIGKKITDTFKPTSTTTTTPEKHTTPPTKKPITPTLWYKTPIGIAAIVASVFVGYKYVLPAVRKKPGA